MGISLANGADSLLDYNGVLRTCAFRINLSTAEQRLHRRR